MSQTRRVILLIDDDPRLREAVRLVLPAEYEVVSLPDGDGFLESVAAYQPDAILLDVRLPGESGFRLCRRLRADARFRAIPVLFLTAMKEDSAFVRALEARGDAYLTKPFRAKALLAALRRIMREDARSGG